MSIQSFIHEIHTYQPFISITDISKQKHMISKPTSYSGASQLECHINFKYVTLFIPNGVVFNEWQNLRKFIANIIIIKFSFRHYFGIEQKYIHLEWLNLNFHCQELCCIFSYFQLFWKIYKTDWGKVVIFNEIQFLQPTYHHLLFIEENDY